MSKKNVRKEKNNGVCMVVVWRICGDVFFLLLFFVLLGFLHVLLFFLVFLLFFFDFSFSFFFFFSFFFCFLLLIGEKEKREKREGTKKTSWHGYHLAFHAVHLTLSRDHHPLLKYPNFIQTTLCHLSASPKDLVFILWSFYGFYLDYEFLLWFWW